MHISSLYVSHNTIIIQGTVENDEFYPGSSNRFAPDKKGSYVEPGMEHLTSNLFVGNLDPMTTEEELTDCFRQYGERYI